MEERARRPALLQADLELVLGRGRLRQQRADGGDLVVGGAVRRRGDREVAVVEVVAGAGQRQRLDRLGRGAHEAGERAVSGLRDDDAVLHRHRVHPVPGLHGAAATDLDDDRVHLVDPMRRRPRGGENLGSGPG